MYVVAGGGLGGLSAAYYLVRNKAIPANKVLILEASDRIGGWVDTVRTANYTFERGPRTIRPKGNNGINTLNLIERLGLSDAVSPILSDHPAAKNRMIYARGKLHMLPSDLASLFVKKKPFSKPLISAVLHDLRAPSEEKDDESIYSFVSRRFGKDVADYAISPMIRGICAGDAKEISVRFLMEPLFEMEQRYGGIVKGLVASQVKKVFQRNKVEPMSLLAQRAMDQKWSVYTLKGGISELPKMLEERLKQMGVTIELNSPITKIQVKSDGALVHVGSRVIAAKHLVAALRGSQLSVIMRQHPQISKLLAEPCVTVGLVNLHYDEELNIPECFGFLVAPGEKSKLLGVVFDSCCLPNQVGTVMTAMIGGKWFRDVCGDNPTNNDLLNIATTEIENILNVKTTPTNWSASILDDCIPQYVVGHSERVGSLREILVRQQLPVSLVGASFDGVGVNDVIMSAKTEVEKIVIS